MFASFEGGLRVYDAYLTHRYGEKSSDAPLQEYDPLLGWRKRANVETFYSSKKDKYRNLIQTNSKGLRDEEYTYQKRDAVKRVLLLGDSVVAGLEVGQKDLIDVRLEELLGKRGTFEVINSGTQAYGTDQQYLYLTHEGYKYKPDVIVHVAVDNDSKENITIHQRKRRFGKAYFVLDENGTLVLKGQPIPKFERNDPWVVSHAEAEAFYGGQWGRKKEAPKTLVSVRGLKKSSLGARMIADAKEILSNLYIYEWLRNRFKQDLRFRDTLIRWNLLTEGEYEMEAPESVQAYERQIQSKLLGAMRDYSKSIDAEFMVYEFANGVGPKPRTPSDVEQICERLNISYLNSFDELYEVSQGKRVFAHPYDGHWNARGHEFASQSIYQFLVNESWV